MRKSLAILTVLSLIAIVGCRKSQESTSDPGQTKTQRTVPSNKENRPPDKKRGSNPQKVEDIDVDKLDIPDQLKEAIKSGRIPKEKIPEILAGMGAGAQGGEAVPVNVQPVQKQDLNTYLVLNGIVEPERKIEIYSRLSAYVKTIVKEEGAYVRQNDILALLDDTEILIGYQQAKISLEQAKLSFEEAERNFDRSKELIKKDLISEQDYQTQEAAYKQRQLDYQNRLEDFKNLELQMNWVKIRSLSEGFVTERLIEVGDKVNANQQVYTIEDFNPLLIRVFVPTSESTQLKPGMPAEITTEVLEGTVFEGDVKLINPRIDTDTGTVKVTVEVFDDSMTLKPGMFVEARIIIGMKEDVLAIPRKSILYKQNKTYVFVLDQNRVSQREVKLGLREEDLTEVTEGLEEGETIVLVGVESLKDGDRVEVLQ